jgi:hypothetical protein
MYQAAPAAGAKLIYPLPEVAGVCWLGCWVLGTISIKIGLETHGSKANLISCPLL